MQGPTAAAGQTALRQTPDQVRAQGQAYMDPNRGNVQAPTMSQEQMVQEAQQTGGTVNPHEATKAVYTPPTVQSGEASWQPTPSVTPPPQRDYAAHVKSGAYGLRRGGIASLWRR